MPNDDYKTFLKQKITQPEKYRGNIVDEQGRVVAKHEGIFNFTIGQRRGLGFAVGKKQYVTGIDPKTNNVVVGPEEHLFSTGLIFENATFVTSSEELKNQTELSAKIRYRTKPVACKAELLSDKVVKVMFNEPV